MQINYASSRGKAKPLLWTSLKPSHQRLSWGDWHCRCFWRRTAGKCTWEPGCTGHCWAGCGWTFFLNEQGRRLPRWDAHKTRRDGAIFLYQINTRCVPDAEQHLIRGSEFYPACLAHWRPWAESWTEIRRNVKLFVPLIPLCCLDLQPETMTKHLDLLKSIRFLRKQTNFSLYYEQKYLSASLEIFPPHQIEHAFPSKQWPALQLLCDCIFDTFNDHGQ